MRHPRGNAELYVMVFVVHFLDMTPAFLQMGKVPVHLMPDMSQRMLAETQLKD